MRSFGISKRTYIGLGIVETSLRPAAARRHESSAPRSPGRAAVEVERVIKGLRPLISRRSAPSRRRSVCHGSSQKSPRSAGPLAVPDDARKEVDEVGGLNCRTAVLAVPENSRIRVRGNSNGTVAGGTRIGCREPAFPNLIDQAVHVDLYLRHDVPLALTAGFARFLPHAQALVDFRGVLEPLRVHEILRVAQLQVGPVLLGHLMDARGKGAIDHDIVDFPSGSPRGRT